MTISKIKLTNFRGHEEFKTDLSPLTIIVGLNGVGKTNIIEAILLSSTTRSHRTNRDRDLINWSSEYARIELDLKDEEEKTKITTFLTTVPTFSKSYMINKNPKKSSEVVGIFQSVLFSPETMDLIFGAPRLRRRFLDIILCQNNRQYMRDLNQYNHVVRERNKLLYYINKGESRVDELTFWDERLVSLGTKIINSRARLIDFLNIKIKPYYQSTSGTLEKTEVIYKNNIKPSEFQTTLEKERQKEIKNLSTLYGPHRDDLLFYLNDHPLATSGSRGECRSYILAMKLSEIDYFKESQGKPPILLLDDVFSELDQERRQRLTSIIKDQQTIITTTDLNDIDTKILKTAKIIQLTRE